MKYFIYAMFFILSITALKAQDFFVPDGAFSSPKEKLRPLNKEAEELTSSFSQRRYRVINGRVFALPNEVDFQEENETQEVVNDGINLDFPIEPDSFQVKGESADIRIGDMSTNNNPIVLQPMSATVTTDIKEEKKEDIHTKVNPPKIAAIDEKIPSYKNRYAYYLTDLQTFQNTGKMPKNNDLSLTIEKLSKPYEVILFQGKLD